MPFVALAVIGLIVALGVPGTAVLAERAKPGDALFGVDKAIEDFRLSLANSPEAQASLKVEFAEERADELAAADPEDIDEAVDELDEAVGEADEAVDDLKIRVKVRGDLLLALDELQRLVAALLAALRDAGVAVDQVKVKVKDDEIRIKISRLEVKIEDEIDEEEDEDVEIRGLLQATGTTFQITAEGKTFTVTSKIDLTPFVGKQVKIEGDVSGTTITVNELKLGDIKVEAEGTEVKVKIEEATVQKSGDAFQVTAEGITFKLVGPLATAELLDRVAGKEAELRGTLKGTEITLTRLDTDGADRIKIEAKEKDEKVKDDDDDEEDEVKLKVKTEVKIRTDKAREEAKIEGREIELRGGTLQKSGDTFTLVIGGTTYTLKGTGLDSFVGKKVKVEGTVAGNVVTVEEIKLDSSGSGNSGSGSGRDDRNRDNDDNDRD